MDRDDKRFLLGLCDRLRHEIAELDYELPAGPVHGDAHVQNLMFTGDTPTMIGDVPAGLERTGQVDRVHRQCGGLVQVAVGQRPCRADHADGRPGPRK
ncbi:hypothetical protein [Saccharothrix obliqua]|uniref:hypothetical protein n=1 Tax=Saccharothrix obliqua TaxID=2861747 RepID=UPI0035589E59